jgi:hypothetical protein
MPEDCADGYALTAILMHSAFISVEYPDMRDQLLVCCRDKVALKCGVEILFIMIMDMVYVNDVYTTV